MRFRRKTRREWNHRAEESARRTISVAVKKLKKSKKKEELIMGLARWLS